MSQDSFKPRILGFLCNWCCYTAADSAGVARYQYPPNIRVIRVMCSGRVDPVFVLEAFACGADGVFIGGCHLGECHYMLGNYDALLTAELVRNVLINVGVSPERFSIEWASAAEGARYVDIITAFTNKLKGMGPIGQAEGKDRDELLLKLRAAKTATEEKKLRMGLGKLTKTFRKENNYDSEVITEKVEENLSPIIRSEVGGQEIIFRLKQHNALSVSELTEKINLSDKEIADFLSKFGKKGLVSESEGRWMLNKNSGDIA